MDWEVFNIEVKVKQEKSSVFRKKMTQIAFPGTRIWPKIIFTRAGLKDLTLHSQTH